MLNSGLFVFLFLQSCLSQKHLQEEFSWKNIDYEFENSEDRKKALELGAYIQGNSLISSIERSGDKLFLAVPRLKDGVPSTLNYISITDVNTKSPRLKPYPSWELNDNLNQTSRKKKMTSIISIRADNCNRLWALDTGISQELKQKKVESPPTLFIFYLNDNTLARRYSLKEDEFTHESKFRNIVIEMSHGNCGNMFAYIADSVNGLVVYDWELNKSYTIKHNYFSFEPIWGMLKTSSDKTVQIDDGLQGMAFSPPDKDGYRNLLFHPLVGINHFTVSTKILQNRTLTKNNITDFYFIGDRGSNMQSSASIVDYETGVLFYTAYVKNSIGCWNSFRGEQFTAGNQGTVDEFDSHPNSYPADLRIDSNGTLWVLTNHLLNFIHEKQENKILYRIYSGTPRQIIRNTVCEEL